jgi:hypothetical protein
MADNENKIRGYPEYAPSEDPRTGKPYELYGDGKDISESNQESGWGVGSGVSPEEYDLSKGRTFNEVRDPNSNVFRYGLWYDIYSNVEDPTLLGFTCEIDDSENSPLFATGDYSARAFIEKYKGMPEIAARENILTQFQRNIKMMFKSMESTRTSESDFPYVKSHYLERMVGLKALSKKFADYKEDEIVFTMHEDVTMFAQYLARLYNNLAYSYRSGKLMIPENLLRFNLVIKITEIRNFKTVVRELTEGTRPEEALRKMVNINSAQLRYTLYDCNFDFFESQNHGDDMQMAGIGSSVPSTSNQEFKINWKYVSRFFKSEIIDDLSGNTNSRTDMNDREYDPRISLGSSAFFKEVGTLPDADQDKNPDNDFKKNPGPGNLEPNTTVYNQAQRDENRNKASQNMQSDSKLNDSLQFDESGNSLKGKAKKLIQREKDNLLNSLDRYKNERVTDWKQLQQSLIQNGLGALQDLKDGVLERFRRQRGELLNELFEEIRDDLEQELGLKFITPENVYTDTFDPNSVQNVINDLGANVYGDIEDFIQGFNNF